VKTLIRIPRKLRTYMCPRIQYIFHPVLQFGEDVFTAPKQMLRTQFTEAEKKHDATIEMIRAVAPLAASDPWRIRRTGRSCLLHELPQEEVSS